MIGWLIFLILAVVVLGLLTWPVRLGRPALMLVGAALFTAAAGYAWQGSPGLPGAPSAGAERPMRPDTLFASERLRFLNHYGETGIALGTADAFNRMNEDQAAAWLLRNVIAKRPNDPDLRIGYAHALFVLAKGQVTPAVLLAFDRADAAAKADNPAPAYFRGLAYLETGDLDQAQRVWGGLRAGLPAGSPWAKPIDDRIELLGLIRRQRAASNPPAP
ncbi:cytochrome C biogenesis protein [Nostoc sp. 3335mG]|nr:cytochrome C biogenesis protein [Nostoc sp. 3335mG]